MAHHVLYNNIGIYSKEYINLNLYTLLLFQDDLSL